MDEIVYDLLLKSPLGFMLLGTLRARIIFAEEAATKAAAGASASLAESLERSTGQMGIQTVEGTIAVQFLSGTRPVPLDGVIMGLDMYPLPLFGYLASNDATRPLYMQLSFLDATHIGGGLVWQADTPRELTFSVLGTQRGFGM